ncbi:MAG: aminoglycoside phosphotransferase family protein [candidate division Zixibacteria bacterium]|nr:aminoglycoside phosphotransferase family protein [candidate division Zixibacteria bacterium]
MDENRLITPLDVSSARQVVQTALPDLEISEIEYLGGGDHSVFAVNNELLFRFPKNANETSTERFTFENRLFDLIRPRVNPHEIPVPLFDVNTEDIPARHVRCYRMFFGQRISQLSMNDRRTVAELLGDFLTRLHSIEKTDCIEIGLRSISWQDIVNNVRGSFEKIKTRLLPLLKPDEREWMINQYELFLSDAVTMKVPVVLIHGDLGDENVLLPKKLDHLQVIDFDEVGFYDPAADFCLWWGEFGDDFLRDIVNRYDLPIGDDLMARVRFYYNRIPVIYFELANTLQNDRFFQYGHELLSARMNATRLSD